jgi:hypothetical protein
MATADDARLIVEFSRWALEWGFHEANAWTRGHAEMLTDYEVFVTAYPPGTVEHRHPFTVLGYFENLGLFFKHHVIDEDLLLDWLDFTSPWQQFEKFVQSQRELRGQPALWENFEALATAQRRTGT